ncbi:MULTISPECIES: IS5 family transposase [Streptomyces]|uniref:IS5 family transposase n=1 Tax=Streptomyces TaxID=1883 RepID=UPI001EF3A873|nr:IS5 family transposase [Streptomyces rochei]
MSKRRPYPSDLSDARWELIEPVLTAWRFERRGRALDFGRPPEHDLRDIMDVILYVDRTGVQWRYLPHDFPHWNTVYGYFARWQQEGVFAQLNGLLRQLLRQKENREAEPSACVTDAQSVKTSTSVLATSQGIDAGKKIVGRKRSIVTDTTGLLLAVLVTAASVQDSIAGTQLLNQVAAEHPRIRKTWVDGGYASTSSSTQPASASTWKSRNASPGPGDSPRSQSGGTYGWLMLHRRLARDYETRPARSEAMIHIAMTDLMARRLTSENTISWRGPAPQTKQQIPG